MASTTWPRQSPARWAGLWGMTSATVRGGVIVPGVDAALDRSGRLGREDTRRHLAIELEAGGGKGYLQVERGGDIAAGVNRFEAQRRLATGMQAESVLIERDVQLEIRTKEVATHVVVRTAKRLEIRLRRFAHPFRQSCPAWFPLAGDSDEQTQTVHRGSRPRVSILEHTEV
jgi:hypothetical protein